MWIVALAAVGLASEKADEEVVVWGDPFLRWNQRWYVETELRVPAPQVLWALRNHELWVHALQVRAVLDCEKDHRLGPNGIEALCTIEDVSLVALPKYPDLASNLDVLVETAEALRGAVIQLQVSSSGKVPNVDLDLLREPIDRRTRRREEALRQVISRVVLPFHIETPKSARPGDRWIEYTSRLLTMPSAQGSAGSSEVAHYLDIADGYWIVQSVGRGLSAPGGGADEVVGAPTDLYDLELRGVGIVDPDTGILTERTWVVTGGMTPSSPGFLTQQTYYHSGRFRMLAAAEHPSVGTTRLAYRPGSEHEPAWTPLAP